DSRFAITRQGSARFHEVHPDPSLPNQRGEKRGGLALGHPDPPPQLRRAHRSSVPEAFENRAVHFVPPIFDHAVTPSDGITGPFRGSVEPSHARSGGASKRIHRGPGPRSRIEVPIEVAPGASLARHRARFVVSSGSQVISWA